MTAKLLKLTLTANLLVFLFSFPAMAWEGTRSQRSICAIEVDLLVSNRARPVSPIAVDRLFRICILRLNTPRTTLGDEQLLDENDLAEVLASELEVEI